MLHCSLCFKTKNGPGDKNFFKVPKDEHRRKKWGEICHIDFKKKTAWICRDHFLPSEIIKTGNKRMLMPNTVPFIPPVKQKQEECVAAISKNQKIVIPDNQEEKLISFEQNAEVNLSQMHENLVMEIPVKKTVFCTRQTQTNTRLCGLVETSDFADDFRLNCFYCSDIFPFEKWKDFINHLKNTHHETEKAFEISEFISEDHDYTAINLPSSTSLWPVYETVGISPESLLPFLGNEEEPTIPINPTFCYTSGESMTVPHNLHILNDFIDSGKSVFMMDSQENSQDPLDSMVLNSNFCCSQDDNSAFPIIAENLNNYNESSNASIEIPASRQTKKLCNSKKQSQIFSVPQYLKNSRNKSSKQKIFNINQMKNLSKQTQRKTVLSRCLKRTIAKKTDMDAECKSDIKISQIRTTEISFEYTPRIIVDLLLDNMKEYPVLWHFNKEPFNDNFYKAVEALCKIINDKWSLNIDNLTMRRSINRVLRFYCYLFPNDNIENIHPFTCYYDKCAEFLPSSVSEIAYARCSHCYICYKNGSELKAHLLKEQNINLKWPYKCVECKECFQEEDEYEFHRVLPHYDEVFRCEPCKKKYFRRNVYNKHMSEYHPSTEGKFKCDQCDRVYKTKSSLHGHKIFHGERKHKCHLCSKSYHENAKLRIHLKIHQNEYDFMCDVCAKVFVTQSALNVHMSKHTGEKVTCKICDLKLRKSSLSRHLRLVHPANEVTDRSTLKRSLKGRTSYRRLIRAKTHPRRKESEGRKYQCKICMINFERYKALAEHNKEFHSDIPKFPCQLCDTAYSNKINLRRHYRKKHNFHAIQAYKLVEENEDLNEVLAIKTEQLERLLEKNVGPRKSVAKSPEVKSEFLSDENSLEEENIQSFIIQDEILEASDNITKEEIKIDYMNDFFTDI